MYTVRRRSQARVVEALLSTMIILGAIFIIYTFYSPYSPNDLGSEYTIPSNVIGFIVENGYLKYIFTNPSVLVKVSGEIIPAEFGFRIALYCIICNSSKNTSWSSNWSQVWSYQTIDFNAGNSISAYLILNGFDGNCSDCFYILVVSVSKT